MCEDKDSVRYIPKVKKDNNCVKEPIVVDFAANKVDPEKTERYLDEFKNILDQEPDNENR